MAEARVVVVPYDPEWPLLFERERELLERVLAPWLSGGVHHIGSTAIPGIAAKSSLDLMAGVRDLEEARAAVEPLRARGYEHAFHRLDALWFRKSGAALHLTEPASPLWRERLAFRDALRADPALAAEYEALKLRLAREHPHDRRAYTDGKRAFVAGVLAGRGIALAPK
ncbi:MAG TPA: GrpB family protein [Gaiellaceae bacterium]|nr:GrpB family protein [Gaiellaceae bacterium]